MIIVRDSRRPMSAMVRPVLVALTLGGLMAGMTGNAQAQDAPRRRAVHARPSGRVAERVLTVHRHAPRFAGLPRTGAGSEGPSPLRRWNDPNLDSFGGWRLGGDNFYGDGAGDSITRGNAGLGAIAGYGPANGGYGGPHFDSVGGFHNGPGPDGQENADYASGSISTPDYGGLVPHYPSVKARVAALTTGVVARGASMHLARAGLRAAPPSPDAGPHDPQGEDLFPDLGLDAF